MDCRKLVVVAIKAYEILTEPNMYPKEPYQEIHSSKTLRANSMYNAKLSGWQIAKRALVVYICFKQILMMSLQYVFDILKIQLKRQVSILKTKYQYQHHDDQLNLLNASSPLILTLSHQQEEELALRRRIMLLGDRISSWQSILKSLGAPFIDMAFVVQCVQYFVIMSSLTLIIATEVYNRWIGPLDIGLIRLILNRSKEQVNIDRLIHDECEKAIHSSKCLASKSLLTPSQRSETIKGISLMAIFCYGGNIARTKITANDHEMIVKMIKHLEQDKSINLLHHKKYWESKICLIYILTVVVLFSGGILLNVLFILLWLVKYPISGSLSWMDCLGVLEFQLAACMSIILYGVGAPILMSVFIDQTYATMKLCQDIGRSIRTNELICHDINSMVLAGKLKAQETTIGFCLNNCDTILDESSTVVEQMNENLLRVIMHYRLFKRQFFALKHYYCYATKVLTVFFLSYPISVVFHLIYLNRISCLYVIGTVWVFVFLYDCAILFICAYHAQLQHLYNKLFDLMGHVDRTQARRPLYNPSIISLVRQEITDPKLGIERLSVIMFSTVFNYKHLLKLHFWTGLLTTYGLIVSKKGLDDDDDEFKSAEQGILRIFG